MSIKANQQNKKDQNDQFKNNLELFIKDLLINKSLSEDQVTQLKKILGDSNSSSNDELKVIKEFIEEYNNKFDNAVNHINEIIYDILSRKDELGIFQGQDLFSLIKNYEKDKEEVIKFNEELKKYAKAITEKYNDTGDSLDHMVLTDKKDIRPREKNLSVGYTMLKTNCDIIGSYLNDDYTILECTKEGTLDTEKKMSDKQNNTVLICKYL